MMLLSSLILAAATLTNQVSAVEPAKSGAVTNSVSTFLRSKSGQVTSARITSRSSDFDKKEGVAMFDGDVFVRYSDDSTMAADRLFMFFANSNELSRVVAIGNVVISNATRQGTCAFATFRRKKGEIEMHGDAAKKTLARLVDSGEHAGQLEGTCIKYWLNAEQVEVQNAQIEVRNSEGKNIL